MQSAYEIRRLTTRRHKTRGHNYAVSHHSIEQHADTVAVTQCTLILYRNA